MYVRIHFVCRHHYLNLNQQHIMEDRIQHALHTQYTHTHTYLTIYPFTLEELILARVKISSFFCVYASMNFSSKSVPEHVIVL